MSAHSAPDAAAVYDAYLAAVRRGERRTAFALIDDASRRGLPLGDIYVHVFQPTLREIGRLWQHNEISVADEHLATAITQAAMSRLYGQTVVAESSAANTLLAACADNERHEVGLRMLCDLLECEGWDARYLGATVPVESLVAMVREQRPDVVALSVALPSHLPHLRTMVDAVRSAHAAGPTPLILVGGRPFVDEPELAGVVGGDLTAPDAMAAVSLLRERFRRSA